MPEKIAVKAAKVTKENKMETRNKFIAYVFIDEQMPRGLVNIWLTKTTIM
jgi:hypothetical protein